MRINFKRLHSKAVLPRKAHESDYAFDCVAVSEKEIAPGVWKYGLGFALQKEKEYLSFERYKIAVYPRSSIYKTGMILSNSVGIVDEGYTGEISVVFYHVMPNMPRYRVGDRVCQIAVESREASQCFRVVDELKVMDRGSNGYGSTGLSIMKGGE